MKPRRDITLGEMQDECKRELGEDFSVCEECKFKTVCNQMEKAPAFWDLSDPPRFNEAQMALLKALSTIGVERIETLDTAAFRMMDKNEKHVSLMKAIGLEENESLDLAELLGKESNEK